VDVAVFTDLGNGRNNINVLTSDVVVACGVEGPGTASEVALALKSGKPVVLLAADDTALRFFERMASGRIQAAAEVPEVIEAVRKTLAGRA
jgi:nucleoside 2-deoxyribosyltransferase